MKSTLALLALTSTTLVHAETIALYAGSGQNTNTDNTPWVVGFLLDTPQLIWGMDFSGEGTTVDQTGGSAGLYRDYVPRDLEQGFSINFLIGPRLTVKEGQTWRFDIAGIVGLRQDQRKCPGGQSYLGYDCYADEDPEASWTFNGGGLLSLTQRNWQVGLRATGESTQLIVGYRFK